MKKVTILSILKYGEKNNEGKQEKYNLKKGDVLTVTKEPDNKHDQDAIKVSLEDGRQIGYLANSPKTTLRDTFSASDILKHFKKEAKIKVIGIHKKTDFIDSYIGELLLEEESNSNKVDFKLIGGITTYPGKTELIKDLKDSPRIIKLGIENNTIVGQYKNELAGRVSTKENELEVLKQYIEDSPEVLAEALRSDKGTIICNAELGQGVTLVETEIDEEVERIINEGINSRSQIKKKLKYLRTNKVPEIAISNLLKSYIKYPDNIKGRIIDEPKVLFIDTEGLIRKAISYINIGGNLKFEGEKATGKNVLTETLAWLYNRPMYEFSSNSQHSNHSLLGGPTFIDGDKEDKEERKKTSKSLLHTFKVFSDIFNKDKSDTNNIELNSIDRFINKILGRSDKEMIFEKSPILEAFEVGGILVLDEFNTSLSHVMSIFNSLLDDRRRMDVTGYGLVEGHINFCAIATQNPDYEGTFETNQATIDRFEPIRFPSPKSIQEVLKQRVPNISYNVLHEVDQLYLKIRSAIEIGDIDEQALSIRGFTSACKVVEQGQALKEALMTSIADRVSDSDDREAVRNIIDLQISDSL